ncbi:MAG: DUF3794 domain-containing protein [Lachnospiraceae bacterium]|nr:DUF3794 domain-containing protein [Lachnospiraceae bacterium]
MELLMKNIHMCHQAKHAVSQMTLDEDLNVPDVKPDVGMIIQSRGHLLLEHTRAESGKLFADGFLETGILYMDDTKERQLCRLDVKLPFEEVIAVDDLEPGESVRLRHETEDLNVSLINSRKLSIRALIRFEVSSEEIYDLSAAAGVRQDDSAGGSAKDSPDFCEKKETLEFLQLEVQKKDILRLKEDISLSAGKPNIREVLWEDIQMRGCRTHLEEGRLLVRGSLFVFVLYQAEDEKESLQWMEQTVPLEGTLACDGCTAGLIQDIGVTLSEADLTVKEDLDGEMRIFHLEGILDLNISLYGTDTAELLADVFSPEKDLELVTADETYETLVVRNESKCRVQGKLKIQGANPRIIQICHCSGSVQIDKTEMVEDGLRTEGVLTVSILYISSDDSMPFAVLEGAIPFAHTAEAQGIRLSAASEKNQYTLTPALEQLSAAMSDGEQIEIRATIGLDLFVTRIGQRRCIQEIREKDIDPERIWALPGITAYLVQEGDTLWEIAKEYFLTPRQIIEANGLSSEQVKKGDCLILMKNGKAFPGAARFRRPDAAADSGRGGQNLSIRQKTDP